MLKKPIASAKEVKNRSYVMINKDAKGNIFKIAKQVVKKTKMLSVSGEIC